MIHPATNGPKGVKTPFKALKVPTKSSILKPLIKTHKKAHRKTHKGALKKRTRSVL